MSGGFKIPESVLVLIHTPDLQVLLLERADQPNFWQSVTGSRASPNEALIDTARREVQEETGIAADAAALRNWRQINAYPIFAHWRHRYAPGVTHNTEHIYSLAVAPGAAVRLNPREHTRYVWLPWDRAADLAFSWTNARALRTLPEQVHQL